MRKVLSSIPLGKISERREKADPKAHAGEPFIGLDDIEAHTMRLLGCKDAGDLKSSAKKFYKGDVLYSRLRPYLNKVWVADREGLCSPEFIVFHQPDLVAPKFLAYRLNSSDFIAFANSLDTGDRPRVNYKQISVFSVPSISLEHQNYIVAKIEELFSELDNGIAALKTAREQLKVYRQAILKHAFDGKLTAQWREEYPEFKKPWKKCCVEELVSLGPSNGKSVKDREGGFPVLRLTALKNGNIDLSEFKEGAWTREEAKRYIVEDGDFLLSRGNGSKDLVGRGGLVISPSADVAFPDTIVRLRLDVNEVYPRYFSYIWESRIIRSQIESSARTTAGIYKINQQHIKTFSLPVPSIEEQKEIVDKMEAKLSIADATVSDIEIDIFKAEILRQSILKNAFSSQLVKNILVPSEKNIGALT